jgi:molecular chaperone GrpE
MPNSPASEPDPRPGQEAAESQQEEQRAAEESAAPFPEAPPSDEEQPSVDVVRDELAAMEERFKRARADLENYRKRAERELERRVAERQEAMLRDWLEVADSVDRALTSSVADPQLGPGLMALRDQIEGVLARQGVTRFGQPGERFDAERHEAVGVRPSGDQPDNTILDVVRSGYAISDRVLRPAQVVVARTTGSDR